MELCADMEAFRDLPLFGFRKMNVCQRQSFEFGISRAANAWPE